MKINQKYNTSLVSENRYLILFGGSGSGKSYFATQKIIIRILKEKNHKVLVLRKFGSTLKNSVYDLFKSIIYDEGLENDFEFTVAPLEIRCKSTGSIILFIGLDDPEKIKSIANITMIWFEEATEFDLQDFKQVDLRLRGQTEFYKQIIMTLNPIDAKHWINKEFFIDKNYSDIFTVHSTYIDNDFIDENYAQTLVDSSKKDANWKDIYYYGKWGQLNQNIIFTNWTVENISDRYEDYRNVLGGVDFGYNHASAFESVSITGDNLYVFDEIYLKRVTNDKFYSVIKEKVPYSVTITADSADPSAISEMRTYGFWVKGAIKGQGSVKSSINWLKRKNIIIHPKCINLIRELQNYSYDFDKKTNEIFDSPIPVDDDAIAALRYAIEPVRLIKEVRAVPSLY